jgi:hypothetical protein
MPYIGKNPVGGGFHKLDSLTASATDTYALTLGSAAYYPESANQLLVSLNGVIQAPQDSFTVSGSDLVFDDPLTGSDSIDFVVALGDVLAVKTVTDGAITTAKLGNSAVTKAKMGTTELDLATIKDSSGTNTAITIDSSGRVTQPKLPHVAVDFGESSGNISYTAGNNLPFDNVYEGNSSLWNTTNYEFTAPVSGVYMISVGILNDGANYVDVDVFVNNTKVLRQGQAASGRYGDLCFAKELSGNDVVHFEMSISDSLHAITGTGRHSYATITLLG